MNITLGILIIFLVSFLAAFWSLRDFDLGEKMLRLLKRRKIKGAIVFFKNKIVHLK